MQGRLLNQFKQQLTGGYCTTKHKTTLDLNASDSLRCSRVDPFEGRLETTPTRPEEMGRPT